MPSTLSRLLNRTRALACAMLVLSSCHQTSPTSPAVATITTNQPSNIRFDSAEAGGTIVLNNNPYPIMEAGICVDSLPDPDITKLKIRSAVDSGSFNCWIHNLPPGANYHVRAYMIQATRVSYGADVSFTSFNYPTALGGYYFGGWILSLTADANNDIFAGGDFAGPDPYGPQVVPAIWNGKAWSFTSGFSSGLGINGLCASPLGQVYSLNYATVQCNVMKYVSGSWSELGTVDGNADVVNQICADNRGNVYATGANYVVMLDSNNNYSQLGPLSGGPLAIATDTAGKLYAGGFLDSGLDVNYYIAIWDGSIWSKMGLFNNIITTICFDPAGNMYVAGSFTLSISGAIQSGSPGYNAGPEYYVAKWDGKQWSALGSLGVYQHYGNWIDQISSDSKGNIYLFGEFTDSAGNYPVRKWDGSSWSTIASFNDRVLALCIDKQDHVYVGGRFTMPGFGNFVAKLN